MQGSDPPLKEKIGKKGGFWGVLTKPTDGSGSRLLAPEGCLSRKKIPEGDTAAGGGLQMWKFL